MSGLMLIVLRHTLSLNCCYAETNEHRYSSTNRQTAMEPTPTRKRDKFKGWFKSLTPSRGSSRAPSPSPSGQRGSMDNRSQGIIGSTGLAIAIAQPKASTTIENPAANFGTAQGAAVANPIPQLQEPSAAASAQDQPTDVENQDHSDSAERGMEIQEGSLTASTQQPEISTIGTGHDVKEKTGATNTGIQQPVGTTGTAPGDRLAAAADDAKDAGQSTWQDSTAFKSVKVVVDGLVIASEAFSPLKVPALLLQKILENVEMLKGNADLARELASRLEIVRQILAGRPESLEPGVNTRLQSLALTMEGKLKMLDEKIEKAGRKRSLPGRFAFAKDEEDELMDIAREINLAIEVAVLDVTVDNRQILRVVRDIGWVGEKVEEGLRASSRMMEGINHLVLNDKLGNVKRAGFGQDELGRPGCTPGTRVALLADLLGWAKKVHSPHLFWLNGVAGTGKSTIAESFSAQLHDRKMLGASFFCSIKVDDRKDAQLIIPTLAKAMARSNAQFREALDAVLESCDDPTAMKLADQYQKLILEPAASAFKHTSTTIVVVIDALDECDKDKATELLLRAIIAQKPSVPLKFFVTSRPETAIRETFDTSAVHGLVRLHDIERDIVQADIFAFVVHSLFQNSAIRKKYGSRWPPPEVQKIAAQAGHLFIVAATMVKYITTRTGNPVQRLEKLASAERPPLSSIDELYSRVLEEAFSELDEDEAHVTHLCLSLLVTALRPLSVNDYARLLPIAITPDGVRVAFVALHSVVRLPDENNDDGTISIYHASFVDYLTSAKQHGLRWFVDTTAAHSTVAEACTELLSSQLCFGISGAVTSYKSNDEQPKRLALPSEMVYACTAWVDHVLRAGVPPYLQALMKTLLKDKWLFWLEALGVEKQVGYVQSLWKVAEDPSVTTDADFKTLLKEIANFAYAYVTPVNHSTPHLYLSAIPFALTSPSFAALSISGFPCLPTIHPSQYHQTSRTLLAIPSQHGKVESVAYSPYGRSVAAGCADGAVVVFNADTGEPLLPPMQGHTNLVTSVAFSPDGSCIASGSWDNTIRIWDAHSGKALLESMQGHTSPITSVAFSPDGSRIASGSDDGTIRIWDAHSGKALLEPMEGHTWKVTSVAFSPDGYRIASGSHDDTICIWDAHSGKALLEPMEGHTRTVTSIAFSPDGSRIASGSYDNTIRIWDAHSGKALLEPMQGHTNPVTSVAFSPDGSCIASGSRDWTIRIWDVHSGKALLEPMQGHSSQVTSVAFSPDGSRIASGSRDWTIRIWDVHSGKALLEPMQGHTKTVKSVAFSPDGSRIASGSHDNTVRIWDAHSGKALLEPMQGHTDWVTSVAFSPDGSRIAFGSHDNTIRIWDAHSGKALLEPMQGHTDWVTSVAFSPDGSRIASGSWDNTICIWDAHSGKALLESMQGHTDWVTSVAFSPDGSCIAFGSHDNTIRVWDAYSGKALLEPMQGHTDWVTSVAFSPDGSRIASGSHDNTIRIWDAHSGKALLEPMQWHTNPVTSVAFSPDGFRIASGSRDNTICIWDAHSGKALLEPMQGHTDWVTSVAFSPDGSCIATGSNDKTVRNWTLHPSPNSSLTATQIFAHHYPFLSLRMGNDGWIRNQSGDLLLWVLPKYRGKGSFPGLHRVIGNAPYIDIELTNAIWHGEHWKQCRESIPDSAHKRWPWPATHNSLPLS
ncbi:vegetative incompatibility protein HET-E-1 [Coprinopsis cinerea AmutBmut pab1-1]|nr:vegetative incompatibility protein HET-E-1 [Coprinopsis cinerea AmutBmut pab1-1]